MAFTLPALQTWAAGLAQTTFKVLELQTWAAKSDWLKFLGIQAFTGTPTEVLPGLLGTAASAVTMAPLWARAIVVAGTAVSIPIFVARSSLALVVGLQRQLFGAKRIQSSWDTGIGPEQLIFDTTGMTFATLEGSQARQGKIKRKRLQWRALFRRQNYKMFLQYKALGIKDCSPNPVLAAFLENLQNDFDARIRENKENNLREDRGIGDRDLWLESTRIMDEEELEGCLEEESACKAQFKEQSGWRLLSLECGVVESSEEESTRIAREVSRLAALRKEVESLRPRLWIYDTAKQLTDEKYDEVKRCDVMLSKFVVRYPFGRPLPEHVQNTTDIGLDVWVIDKTKKVTTAMKGESDVPSLFDVPSIFESQEQQATKNARWPVSLI
jgi:hypothetical protein